MTKNNQKLLVVEDDKPICSLIATTLGTQGYLYSVAETGAQAILQIASHNPDVVLLDLGLPDMDGIDIIKQVRTWSSVPIIVISARSDDKDKIEALDAGADDYLTKPFNVEELLARLRSTLRRISYIRNQEGKESTVFQNGGLVIDFAAAAVSIDGKELHLTPMEYKLICLLARNVGKVLTHRYIIDQVWLNGQESDIPSLRVFMATLRKKIEPDRNGPQYIQTRVGIGYKMNRLEDGNGE